MHLCKYKALTGFNRQFSSGAKIDFQVSTSHTPILSLAKTPSTLKNIIFINTV